VTRILEHEQPSLASAPVGAAVDTIAIPRVQAVIQDELLTGIWWTSAPACRRPVVAGVWQYSGVAPDVGREAS
jgi:hypothetical protein